MTILESSVLVEWIKVNAVSAKNECAATRHSTLFSVDPIDGSGSCRTVVQCKVRISSVTLPLLG
jgi:hypothetical protein